MEIRRGIIVEDTNNRITITKIIDTALSLISKNIVNLIIIGAIFLIPVGIMAQINELYGMSINEGVTINSGIPEFGITWYGVIITIMNYIISFVLGSFATSSVIKLLYEKYKDNSISWKESISFSLDRKGKILKVNLVLALINLAIVVVIFIIGMILTLILSYIGALIFSGVMIIYAALAMPILQMYISVLVIKDCESSKVYNLTNTLFKGEAFKNNIKRVAAIGAISSLVLIISENLIDIKLFGPVIVMVITYLIECFISASDNIIAYEELGNYESIIEHDDQNNDGYDW